MRLCQNEIQYEMREVLEVLPLLGLKREE